MSKTEYKFRIISEMLKKVVMRKCLGQILGIFDQ